MTYVGLKGQITEIVARTKVRNVRNTRINSCPTGHVTGDLSMRLEIIGSTIVYNDIVNDNQCYAVAGVYTVHICDVSTFVHAWADALCPDLSQEERCELCPCC